jgi:hypothetical protein
MFVKTCDAEIISVVDPCEIEDDDKRKFSLATALDKAKDKISAKVSIQNETEN